MYILLKQGHSLYNQHTQYNQEINIDSTISSNFGPRLNFTDYLNNVSFSFLGHNSILEHMLHLVVISYNFLQSGAVSVFPCFGYPLESQKYRHFIPYYHPQPGSIWCFLITLRLCILVRNTTEMMLTTSGGTLCQSVLLLMILTLITWSS